MVQSETTWNPRVAICSLAIGALVLIGGSWSAAQAQDTETIVIARDMDIDSLDPSRAFCDTCQIYVSSVYERLVDLAPDNRSIVPLLAESWDVNDDQTQFTFRLDPDARFSDGSSVEAKDVKWSFERLKNIKSSPAFLMDGVESIETPDEQTVVIELAAPNSEFLGILTAPYTGIINSDLAMEHGATAGEDADSADQAERWFLENSAGSGPFTLSAYRPNDELRLARNENYWRDGPGVDAIVFRQTQNAVAQAQMLEGGSADIAMQIDPDTAASITSGDVTVETVPSFNFVYVAVGAGAEGLDFEMNRNVREAIALALDYEGIIDLTVAGQGNLQAAPIPNGFPGTEDLPLPARDLDRARELLEEENLDDGILLEAVFPGINVYGVDLSLMMQKVQQDLADVGIEITLQPVTFSVWRERITTEGIPLTAVFYAPDYFGSGQYVQFFGMMEGTAWHSRAHAARALDAENPNQAELLANALAASEEESATYFRQLAEEMIHDRIIIPVVSPNLVLAYRNDIEGVRYSACCNLPTVELQRK